MARNLTKSLSNEVDDLKDALLRAEAENETLRQQPAGGARSATPTSQVNHTYHLYHLFLREVLRLDERDHD